MSHVTSVVVCRFPRGYVASLRFEDKTDDLDVSANSRWGMYALIEKLINEDGLRTSKGVKNPWQSGTHLRFPNKPKGRGFAHRDEQRVATSTARVSTTY